MASTVLTRTPSGAGNQKKWTYSIWFKRQHTNTESALFCVGDNPSTDMCMIRFDPDKINFYSNDVNAGRFLTNQLFRDINGFYHVVLAYDSANATTDNRVKLYVNGQRISTSDMTNVNTVVQNTDSRVNSTSTIYIGERPDDNAHFYGIMSHIHFCDGYAYDADDFGEYDANGVWKINTSPSVTYGTNGFFILKDGNSVTDQSGNGNNFTVAGGTLTNTEDSPSNVFATGNPLDTKVSFAPVFSNGNNTMSGAGSGTGDRSCRGTLGFASGKFYWEIKYTSNSTGNSAWTGILNPEEPLVDGNTQSTQTTNNVLFNLNGGELRKNGSLIATYSGAVNDIFGFAYDLDAGTLKIHKNGTYFNSGNAVVTSISADTYLPYFAPNSGSAYVIMNPNFGNGYFGTTAVSSAGTNASGIGIFEYDVPTGYTALSTKGLNL